MYYVYFIENILHRICRSLQFALYSFRHFLSVMRNITKEANCFIHDLSKNINLNRKLNGLPHQMDTKILSVSFLKKIWCDINKKALSILQKHGEDPEFKIWCRPLETLENKEKKL